MQRIPVNEILALAGKDDIQRSWTISAALPQTISSRWSDWGDADLVHMCPKDYGKTVLNNIKA